MFAFSQLLSFQLLSLGLSRLLAFPRIFLSLVLVLLSLREAFLCTWYRDLVWLRCQSKLVLKVGAPLMPVMQLAHIETLRLSQLLMELKRSPVHNLRLVRPRLLAHLLLQAILAQYLLSLERQQLLVGENLPTEVLISVEIFPHEP